jgi:hypothetical protein
VGSAHQLAKWQQTIAVVVLVSDAHILRAVTTHRWLIVFAHTGVLMEKQLIARFGKAKPENAHQLVQDALRSAATASTPNGAIDLLGDALIELERLLALTSMRVH